MVGCMKKKFLSGLMSLGILLFVIIIISIPNLWPCVLFFLKPFESENRPEVLTLFVTIIISSISGLFAYKQYHILKMRDLLKMQKIINFLYALLNYHVKKILEMNSKETFMQLSTEMVITQNEIQLIYELEQLIYEHVDITDTQDKKIFIARTTEIILEMRELVYGLNSIYMCEDQRKIFPINSEKFKRATMILKDIEEFRMSLYKYTDLKKIQGVA